MPLSPTVILDLNASCLVNCCCYSLGYYFFLALYKFRVIFPMSTNICLFTLKLLIFLLVMPCWDTHVGLSTYSVLLCLLLLCNMSLASLGSKTMYSGYFSKITHFTAISAWMPT